MTEDKGLPVLSYRFREAAWQQLQADAVGQDDPVHRPDGLDGRRDRAGLSEPAPRGIGVSRPEACQHLSLRPQRHWTDQKIRVHVFYCVLALMLCGLLRRETASPGDRAFVAGVAGGAGPDPRSVRRLPRH